MEIHTQCTGSTLCFPLLAAGKQLKLNKCTNATLLCLSDVSVLVSCGIPYSKPPLVKDPPL